MIKLSIFLFLSSTFSFCFGIDNNAPALINKNGVLSPMCSMPIIKRGDEGCGETSNENDYNTQKAGKANLHGAELGLNHALIRMIDFILDNAKTRPIALIQIRLALFDRRYSQYGVLNSQ